jgi:hypothetical protein
MFFINDLNQWRKPQKSKTMAERKIWKWLTYSLNSLVGFLCFIGIHDFKLSKTEAKKGFFVYGCRNCPELRYVKTDIEVYG